MNPNLAAGGQSSKPNPNVKRELYSRLAKYFVLFVLVAGTLQLVFDSYSFYIARREIDAELKAKGVSSLEYLNVLSQRERALAISSLEGRCTERLLLTLFRITEVEGPAVGFPTRRPPGAPCTVLY